MTTDAQRSEPPKTSPRTGIEARRRRARREARRAILEASRALLAESEAGDFSIRSLAGKCGYSAPTVYYHFGDKDGLLVALLDDFMQTIALQLATARAHDPLTRLRTMLVSFIRYATANPTFAPLWSTVYRQTGGEMPPAYKDVKERVDAALRELVALGRFNGLDKNSAEQMLWALLHGLIAIQTARPDHPWAPGLAERAVDSLLRGMTTPVAGARGEGQ